MIAQRSLIHGTLEVRALLLIHWKSHPGCRGSGRVRKTGRKKESRILQRKSTKDVKRTNLPKHLNRMDKMRRRVLIRGKRRNGQRDKSDDGVGGGGEGGWGENGREEAKQRRRGAVIHRQASRHMASLCRPLVASQEECLVTRWCCMSQPKWGNRDAGAAESRGSSFWRLSLMSRQLKCSNHSGRLEQKTFVSKAHCVTCRGLNMKVCLFAIYSCQLL